MPPLHAHAPARNVFGRRGGKERTHQRRLAHQYKIDGVTAVYDIAVEDNPRQAVLDMLVLVTLQWYAAESHAEQQFPDDHPLIRERARVIKDSAWTLAAKLESWSAPGAGTSVYSEGDG